MTSARILVVEDEAIVARDIQLQLQELGYLPVGHATRGEEAVVLARLMGGDVGLRSELGAGSTFWFTALVQRGQGALAAPGELAVSAEDALRTHHAGKRVLVVDDDPFSREIACGMLEAVGLYAVLLKFWSPTPPTL